MDGITLRINCVRDLLSARLSLQFAIMSFVRLFSLAGAAAIFCVAAPANAEPSVQLQQVFSNVELERPVALIVAPDDTGRQFLVEQTGKIKILPEDEQAAEATLFLDWTEKIAVEKDFEEGLLGMAFHPEFKTNGRFYLSFSRQGPKRLVISELKVVDGKADPASERILMEVQQPEWNHNGGNLLFGQDGKLFIGVGDGGYKNGIFMLPQKLTRWNGKVLRIDVDGSADGRPYGIPEDNPFVGVANASPEIWAYGLRNPWGMSIDPETGLFWLADVGQDLWEEINIIEKGGNYGWEYKEGTHWFAPRAAVMEILGGKKDPPRGTQFIEPIHEYSHADGLSITGGVVYRGKLAPSLSGYYVYGDWKFGTLWALQYDAEKGEKVANHELYKPTDNNEEKFNPTGFYFDRDGELVVLDWDGQLFRLVDKK